MALIEVFADVRCPFAHVGLRRLVQRRDTGEINVTLRIRAWPLELVNGAPLDPVAGEGYFCPVLDISRENGRLRIVDTGPVFDEFVERVSAG